MATTDTEKVVTLNIKADGAIKSMKDLKQAIKDGKDQLVQLDQTSEEYEQTLSKVAELQHQYREINEEVNRSTMDFGQTLSNVNSVMAGGVAAIQGVTAGLSLMGVDLGDDDKLTKNLVKSMSLLQSMSKMDAAVKGFKALAVAIKANITAAGGLGKALKMLALNNPFTAILAGVTAVIATISIFSSKAKEAAENTAAIGTAMAKIQDADFQNAMNGGIEAVTKFEQHARKNFDKVYQSALDSMELTVSTIEKYKDQEHDIEEENVKWLEALSANRRNNQAKQYEEEYKKWTEYLAKQTDTSSEMYKQMEKNQQEAQMKVHAVNIAFYQQEIRALDAWLTVNADHLDAATRDMITQRRIALQQMITEEAKLYNNVAALPDAERKKKEKEAEEARRKAQAAAQKAKQDRENRLANQYKHELSLLKQANQLMLAEEERRYQEDLKLYENNEVKKEEITLEHQKRIMDINNSYMQQQIVLINARMAELQKMNKDGSKQGDIDSLMEQINELNRKIYDNTAEYDTNSRAVERNRIQRELELKQLQKRLEMDRKVHDQQMETTLVMQQFDADEIEGIKERLSWLDYLGISYSEKYEMMMEKQRELIQLEQEEKEAKVNVEAIQQEIDLWHEKYDAIEELTAEHYEELRRLEQEYEEASAALGEVRLKRIQKELTDERRERLAYANAVGQIMGTIGSLLTSIADAEGVSFEESKKIKIAAATVDTIQGGINAYMSYIASAIPPPTDSILGGIAAAATVAMGMIEIAKIRATKPGNSPSLSGTAMQGITLANPQIVNLNAVNDEIELPNQKVYVTEYDIRETMRRVEIVEDNSNF